MSSLGFLFASRWKNQKPQHANVPRQKENPAISCFLYPKDQKRGSLARWNTFRLINNIFQPNTIENTVDTHTHAPTPPSKGYASQSIISCPKLPAGVLSEKASYREILKYWAETSSLLGSSMILTTDSCHLSISGDYVGNVDFYLASGNNKAPLPPCIGIVSEMS